MRWQNKLLIGTGLLAGACNTPRGGPQRCELERDRIAGQIIDIRPCPVDSGKSRMVVKDIASKGYYVAYGETGELEPQQFTAVLLGDSVPGKGRAIGRLIPLKSEADANIYSVAYHTQAINQLLTNFGRDVIIDHHEHMSYPEVHNTILAHERQERQERETLTPSTQPGKAPSHATRLEQHSPSSLTR